MWSPVMSRILSRSNTGATWFFHKSWYASNPVLVHRLVCLLHASFRPRLTATPSRFAITSPPSGCEGDFHPQAVEHARHTEITPRCRGAPLTPRPARGGSGV